MSVSSTRSQTITFTGDVTGTETISAATNAASPGAITIQSLAAGDNTISVPSTVGVTVTAVTITPPVGNTKDITLKGGDSDVGLILHHTDPTTLALDSSVTEIILEAEDTIANVRFFWS